MPSLATSSNTISPAIQQDIKRCTELQSEEVLALQSIFEDNIRVEQDRPAGGPLKLCIIVKPELENRQSFTVLPSLVPLKLMHLPPILLGLELPVDYPSASPPEVSLSSIWTLYPPKWLSEKERELSDLWDHDLCLFTIIESLRRVPKSDDAHIVRASSDRAAGVLLWHASQTQNITTKGSLESQLKRYDRDRTVSQFRAETFGCGICLESLKGCDCLQLESCEHVFCRSCLTDYFTVCITEGQVNSVHCPNPDCSQARAKAEAEAEQAAAAADRAPVISEEDDLPGSLSHQEVVSIVGEELSQRHANLCEMRRIERDPTIVSSCPRSTCQAPVRRDADDAYVKLGICSKCGYTFCVACHRGWHGNHVPCGMSNAEAVARQYKEGTDEQRRRLEQLYGAPKLERIVAQYEEDLANAEYLNDNTTPCPGCAAPISKTEGCNKMVCRTCGTKFCYKCGEKLPQLNPYKHYARGNPCGNMLFGFDEEEEERANWEAILNALMDDVQQRLAMA